MKAFAAHMTPVSKIKTVPLFPRSNTVIQRKPPCPCGGGCPKCKDNVSIQTKLKINEPQDKYEQEADRVADEIMRMSDSGLVQRESEQMSESGDNSVSDNFLNNLGSGQPLDPATREFFEPRFGHDFSRVRIHTDDHASRSAQAVNALACTGGQDVVFGWGQYAPETIEGKRLLAHELTHVVQQGGRSFSPGTAANTVNRQARSGYNVIDYPQLGLVIQKTEKTTDGDTPPTGDCSGWEIDHVSFSINVARHYVQTEMDPKLANEARSVKCENGNYPATSDCKVTFSGKVTIRIGFEPSKREVHAWNRNDKGDWLCMYKYDCMESGELVLSKIGCFQIASATQSGD